MAMNPSLHYQRCEFLRSTCSRLAALPVWSADDYEEAQEILPLCHEYNIQYSTYAPLEKRLIPVRPL